jgi:hypothetical protein
MSIQRLAGNVLKTFGWERQEANCRKPSRRGWTKIPQSRGLWRTATAVKSEGLNVPLTRRKPKNIAKNNPVVTRGFQQDRAGVKRVYRVEV